MSDQKLNTGEIRTYLMEKDGIDELIRRTLLNLCSEVDELRELQTIQNMMAFEKEITDAE